MHAPIGNGNGALYRWLAGVLAVLFTSAVTTMAAFAWQTNGTVKELRVQVNMLQSSMDQLATRVTRASEDVIRLQTMYDRDREGR